MAFYLNNYDYNLTFWAGMTFFLFLILFFNSFEIKIKLSFSSIIQPPRVDLANLSLFNLLIKFTTFFDLGGYYVPETRVKIS